VSESPTIGSHSVYKASITTTILDVRVGLVGAQHETRTIRSDPGGIVHRLASKRIERTFGSKSGLRKYGLDVLPLSAKFDGVKCSPFRPPI
jgi:hypothetical protein